MLIEAAGLMVSLGLLAMKSALDPDAEVYMYGIRAVKAEKNSAPPAWRREVLPHAII